MKKNFFTLFFAMILMIAFVFEAVAQVGLPATIEGQVDWLNVIGQLIANPKAFVSASGVAFLVLLTVQAIKRFDFKFINDKAQFTIITVFGLIYSFLIKKIGGDAESSAIIIGILGSGGASQLWKAIKMLFPKLLDYLGENK